jgi:LysR family transcriptional regulator of gallate degradation
MRPNRRRRRQHRSAAQRTAPQAAALLAEVHHMPSVAASIGVSQPAVSQAIARLEDALGSPLPRTARGMVPTDAGRRWVVRFERVLAELRHIRADIAALPGCWKVW